MTSIVTDRKFLIKSPNEILQDKIEELLKEKDDESVVDTVDYQELIKDNKTFMTQPRKINIENPLNKKPILVRPYKKDNEPAKKSNYKYFIPKYYI